MHERFSEGWRAGNYVGSGMLSDFPELEIEIVLENRGHRRRVFCPAKDVARVVAEMCRAFPKASVYYHPESAIGFVAQVRCHCGHEGSAKCCKANAQTRARVVVVLKPPADQDTQEYRTAIAAAVNGDGVEQHRESRVKHRTKPDHGQKKKHKAKKKTLFGFFK